MTINTTAGRFTVTTEGQLLARVVALETVNALRTAA